MSFFTVYFTRSPVREQMVRSPAWGQMSRVTIHHLSPKHKIYVRGIFEGEIFSCRKIITIQIYYVC